MSALAKANLVAPETKTFPPRRGWIVLTFCEPPKLQDFVSG
jgi:hypothetical protein